MCRQMVNNKNIKTDFEEMLFKDNNIEDHFRTLIIFADSGQGKSTVLNYLYDYSKIIKIKRVLIDFKLLSSVDEIDFLDYIVNALQAETGNIDIFINFNKLMKKYARGHSSKVVIEDASITNTSIGNVKIDNIANKKNMTVSLINVFCKDYLKIKNKIVLLFDNFEIASENIRNLILKNFIVLNRLGVNTFFVIASKTDFDLDGSLERYQSIKKYRLPQVYRLEDWEEYCNKVLMIDDREILKTCYKCWKDKPAYMLISLKPFIGMNKNYD